MRGYITVFFDHPSTVKPTTIIKNIADVDNVKFAHLVTGEADAMAYVDAPDPVTFGKAVLDVNAIRGVNYTRTNASIS